MNIGLVLALVGLLLWLLGGFFLIGIILIVVGLVWAVAPVYAPYPRRRGIW